MHRSAVVLLALASCSSDPEEIDDPDLTPITTNPDGVPYPTDHLGGRERSPLRPGDRIPPYTFRGYRDGDRSKGLQPIGIAEYFDPTQSRHKVLHVQLAATWCGICSAELTATVPVTKELNARGIALLQVVVAGATASAGPSQAELDGWVDRHGSNFHTAIDVGARRLGAIGVNGSAMPHDLLIDTRTMEILDSSLGAPLDVAKYGQDGLDFVEKNPPSTY
ncbi:MAG: hypothetical protein KF837_42970 [Labilithrix sp.]|nr:hypothetical protein [Labilithrix sp.]